MTQLDDILEHKEELIRSEMTREELIERVEVLERTIEDWAPFVNQMRMTMAQLALHPMVRAMVPPQFQHTLAQYAPPKD